MASVRSVLGPHGYMLLRYGISPEEEITQAARKLEQKAPHLARLLKEIATLQGA